MRDYRRGVHDGVVLDDVRDLEFLNAFRHVFQGKYNQEVSFSDGTAGGAMAYHRLMFRTPFVATCNFATENLGFLDSHDFIGKPENVFVLRLAGPPWETSGGTASPPAAGVALPIATAPATSEGTEANHMRAWSAQMVSDFFVQHGLPAAAKRLCQNDVDGADLLAFDAAALTADLGFSPFAARKVLATRDAFSARRASAELICNSVCASVSRGSVHSTVALHLQ